MKNIAIIMGGYSSEQKSLISGNVVYNLDKSKYNGFRIHFEENGCMLTILKPNFLLIKNDFSVTVNGTKVNFDCVFNAIHGTPGEDGPEVILNSQNSAYVLRLLPSRLLQ
jgi:D-alanine-D-alanine ligase